MNTKRLQFEIVTTHDAFRALAPEWDALWRRARGAYAQSFSFCWHSLVATAEPQGRELCCVIARESGRLVLLWPLLRYRQRLWTALRPLNPGASEACEILLEPGAQAGTLVDAAWRHVHARCRPDLVYLPYVPVDSRLHGLAAHSRWMIRADSDVAPVACLAHFHGQGWDAFRRSLGDHEPGRYARIERRLSTAGAVGFHIVAPGDPACGPFIDRLLDWKRQWARRRGVESEWIFSRAYRDFLIGLATDAQSVETFYVMVLTLDGTPIALNLLGLAPGRADGITGSFDPAFAAYSPGTLLKSKYVRWAFEQGCDFEFGVGTEPFKLFWSGNHCRPLTSFQVAATLWGRVGIVVRDAARRVRRRPGPVHLPAIIIGDGHVKSEVS